MSWLDLDTRSSRDLLEQARQNPIDLSKGDVGIFDGVMAAPFKGAAKGLIVEPARALNLALSALPRALDAATGGTKASDWWFEKMVSERSGVGRAAHELTPDPRSTGIVGQILNSFFDIGSQAVAFGPVGAGTLKGTSKALELSEKGVDSSTALKAAVVEGVATGVGVHLPMSIGLRSFGNAFYGAAASALPNAASRGAIHTILAENGYHELAQQYQWLDRQQIAIDAILGVGLGFLGTKLEAGKARELAATLRQSDVDTALAAGNTKHAEIDAAPGIPTTPAARDAHVGALMKAMDDLIEGRPVDVSETRVHEERFIPNPNRAPLEAEVKRALKGNDEAVAAVKEFDEAAPAPRPLPEAKPTEPSGEATAKPAAESDAAAKAPEDPDVRQAMQVLTENPDLAIRLVDGTTMKAADAVKAMDDVVAQAKTEASAFDAAVQCFLRG